MHREVLDPARCEVLLGDVAGGAADAERLAVFVLGDARVDADPAVLAASGHEMRNVIADFAFSFQRCEKPAVRDVGCADLEIEETASHQVFRREAEDFVRRVVEIGEAALRIRRPDQVVRGLDQVAVAILALEQAGLSYVVVETDSAEGTPGVVASQNPAPGTKGGSSTSVTLVVPAS